MEFVAETINKMNNGEYDVNDKKYKYSIDIAKQNISHKQQYIGLTRKNSLSIWSKLFPQYIDEFKINNNVIPERIESHIITQLKSDWQNMQKGENVSDLGIILTRAKKTENPSHLFSHLIAQKYFPSKENTDEQQLKTRMRFNKYLSKLSKYYREKELDEFNKKTMFRQARNNGNYGMWCSLKNRPISERISNPTPMKVEVAPLDELKPFLDYLKSNKDIQENFFDKDRKNMCMKFTRGALYHDGRMDMCKQVVGSPHIGNLMQSLKFSDKIQHFLLGNNIIGTIGAKEIANYINEKHNIKTWYLAGNEINSEGIKYICDALVNDTICKDLWLKRNPIGIEGCKHLKYLLENNKTIETLDLHNTGIMEGCKEIFEGLKKNTTLKILYLDSNGMTKNESKYIVDYFNYLVENNIYGIDSIWLDINRFEDDGIIEILESISKYKHLKRFNIGSNGISEKVGFYIYKAFKDHPNLKVLDLGIYKSTSDLGELSNRLGDEGIKYIAELIKENNFFEFLSITCNGVSASGIELIANALQHNKSIIQLEYQQYGLKIDQETIIKIKSKLGKNRKNKELKDVNQYIRFLKHTDKIINIDSIYRNNSK